MKHRQDRSPESLEKLENVDFETALNYTGFGRYTILLIAVCGFTLFSVNSEAYSIGFILPSAECDLNLNTYTKGFLTTTNFIGIIISCCFWGYLSDTKGRRNVLVISLFIAFLCSLTSSIIPGFWGFAILRFLNGIFLSGSSSVIFAYFGEFQGSSYRSKTMASMNLLIGVALIFLPLLGWLLLTDNLYCDILSFQIPCWRLFLFINSLSSLICVIALYHLPESPKFLYYCGDENSLKVLQHIYSVNYKCDKNKYPVRSLEKINVDELIDNTEKGLLKSIWEQIAPLFQRPHLKYTLAASLMQAGVFAVSSGLYIWYPDIIKQISAGNSSTMSVKVCEAISIYNLEETESHCGEALDSNIYVKNAIVGVIYVCLYALWGVMTTLIGNLLSSGISALALCFINFTNDKFLIDILFIILLIPPGVCIAVINLIIVNIVPTHLCGMAVCIIMTAGRIGSIITSSMVGILLEWNCDVTFYLFALNLLGCIILAFIFPKGH